MTLRQRIVWECRFGHVHDGEPGNPPVCPTCYREGFFIWLWGRPA